MFKCQSQAGTRNLWQHYNQNRRRLTGPIQGGAIDTDKSTEAALRLEQSSTEQHPHWAGRTPGGGQDRTGVSCSSSQNIVMTRCTSADRCHDNDCVCGVDATTRGGS